MLLLCGSGGGGGGVVECILWLSFAHRKPGSGAIPTPFEFTAKTPAL
jgi:hypothetical protein